VGTIFGSFPFISLPTVRTKLSPRHCGLREDFLTSFFQLAEEEIVSISISSSTPSNGGTRTHVAQLLLVSFGGSLNPSMRGMFLNTTLNLSLTALNSSLGRS
jgi:hypothetical protein